MRLTLRFLHFPDRPGWLHPRNHPRGSRPRPCQRRKRDGRFAPLCRSRWLHEDIQKNPAGDKAHPNYSTAKTALGQKPKDQQRDNRSDTHQNCHSAKHETATVVRIPKEHGPLEPQVIPHHMIRLEAVRQQRSRKGHRHRQKKKAPPHSAHRAPVHCFYRLA